MTCQEVMEYMQRSLDRDLSEPESEKMQDHLLGCASCSSIYERLRSVAAELEKLPKVAPKSSLVDAILPKLDEIDRIKASGGDVDGMPPRRPDSSGAANAPVPPKRKRNGFLSWKLAGGAAAAAVLLGVFLFNQSPKSLQNAEGYLKNSAATGGVASNSAAAAEDTAKVPAAAEHMESASEGTKKAESKRMSKLQPSSGGQGLAAPSSPDGSRDGSSAGGANADAGTSPPGASDAAKKPSTMNDSVAVDQHAVTFMSMQKVEPPTKTILSVSSPDQTLTANVLERDGSFEVAVRDKNGNDVYVSRMYPADQVRNVKWSEDGKQLAFDLDTGESAAHVHVDLEHKTETEN
ncbi:anti-sigma factor family protein [Ferviditalea candida]|uniref:Zf-HC2 domain-containing protein n=1 Tax=Ferviditalea candida TaxID=3108399 RepID=A0ABU5ZHZ0_9BACL|nr:zf-HC2 domain-containing protein [Paenibacillaceae bacterium T2]